jgi:ATP-binding cassette subfamily B protein
MYNVSDTLYTLLPLPLLSYGIFKLSSEINKRVLFFSNIYQKYRVFHKRFFSGVRVIKTYSLEEQHQNNMENLAYESKIKVLS